MGNVRPSRLIIIVFIIIIPILAGGGIFLWYIGGQTLNQTALKIAQTQTAAMTKNTQSQPAISLRPTVDANNNGTKDWEEKFYTGEKSVSLVLQALEKKQEPLIPMDVLPVSTSKTYQLSDLQLADQADELSLTNYGTEIMEIMSVYRSPGLGNEITMILGAANDGDVTQNIQSVITKSADRYETSADKLLALIAPRSAGQIHLNLINNLMRLSENARLMAQINEEPVIALGAAQLQTNRLRQMLVNINNVNLFFAGHNLGLEKKKAVIAIDL
mgnify:CR=1 FL=1